MPAEREEACDAECRRYGFRSVRYARNALPGKELRCSLDQVPLPAVHWRQLGPDALVSPRTRGLRLRLI